MRGMKTKTLQLEMMDDDGGGGGDADGDDRIGGGVRTEDGDENKKKHVGFALFSSIWWLQL